MGLTEQDYIDAAQSLRCEVAVIKAVAEVESKGNGFLKDGRCKILYEPHIFHRYTGGKFARSYPTLSYKYWKRGAYGLETAQWPKFLLASKLDPRAAILACSWGRFQLMGFNHVLCGFSDPELFKAAMERSERDHLMAFVEFVRRRSLDDELQRKDWIAFARGYNGEGFAANQYDVKMERAYKRFAAAVAA